VKREYWPAAGSWIEKKDSMTGQDKKKSQKGLYFTYPVNPRAGNGILHPYTGNGGGGKLPPRAFQVMMLANG